VLMISDVAPTQRNCIGNIECAERTSFSRKFMHTTSGEDSKMTKIVDVLLDSFNRDAKQAKVVLAAAKSVDMDYTPGQGMKPLKELANHLAQIPSLDHRMYSREIETVEQAQAQEKELSRDDIDGMLSVFDDGIAAVNAKFRDMSDKDLLENKLKPFYETRSEKNWAYYMPEFIRHIAMHKMQLWMYLKLAGAKVDMMTYYGVPPK